MHLEKPSHDATAEDFLGNDTDLRLRKSFPRYVRGSHYLLLCLAPLIAGAQTISGPADNLLNARTAANRSAFFVYQDQDAGTNHGVASGFFYSAGSGGTLHIDTGCVDDPLQQNGCSVDPNRIDTGRGTVLRVSFDPQTAGNFAELAVVEPNGWTPGAGANGYDLTGVANLVFDIRAQGTAAVQVGVDGCTAPYATIGGTWTTMTVPLSSLSNCSSASSGFTAVHILFSIATDGDHAPGGATVLVDNIRFDPPPASHAAALGFPVSTQTFGIVPSQTGPIGGDQAARNVATAYESALALLSLIEHGTDQDLANAQEIADAFDYALHHDNHGDPLPAASDGSTGLHSAYSDGDLPLWNSQPSGGLAGDVRLAGFTATNLCPGTGFCLVLDGATGGNNAFAVLALISAYERFQNPVYLADAAQIGTWIVNKLADASGTGYGGYYNGYTNTGSASKPLDMGKSVENNADIFAAFQLIATAYDQAGDSVHAAQWRANANAAGDFVMQLFDAAGGRFNAGTVPVGTVASPGICPEGAARGADVINVCDFLDANTSSTLALATAPRYSRQIDWTRPIQYVKATFGKSIGAVGQTFQGFSLVAAPTSGAEGIAWEFTGQTVAAMSLLDRFLAITEFQSDSTYYLGQLLNAQLSAPFGDTQGLVASTLQSGEQLPLSQQCLATPFQCIPERVGIAATAWAIAAEASTNPFTSSSATFVNELYLNILQRPADPGGLAFWTSQLISKQLTRAAAAADLFSSSEAQRTGEWIADCYLGVLGRSPDLIGWEFWISQVHAGATPLQVVSAFLDSSEGQGIYGALSNADFVTALYLRVLQRAPDPGGYDLWLSQLDSGGATREDVMFAFVTSSEFMQRIANESTVNVLYLALLHRTGEPGGVAAWVAQLQSGAQLETVIGGFLASDEFRSRIN